ncbi:MAG: toll/interleukin-1 receptor domain-containing protein [Thermoanaerobaculia bacterium]
MDRSVLGLAHGAFVSYRHTHSDRQWARWLHSRLETYRVPARLVASGAPRRIGRVFRDEEELPASADLSQRIDEALSQARFLIVVCSPRTPASRWVDEEVKRFQALGRADRVLALLIEGEPAQSFPAALRDREPLAADVRPEESHSRRNLSSSEWATYVRVEPRRDTCPGLPTVSE